MYIKGRRDLSSIIFSFDHRNAKISTGYAKFIFSCCSFVMVSNHIRLKKDVCSKEFKDGGLNIISIIEFIIIGLDEEHYITK